jgi:hypothetical protein
MSHSRLIYHVVFATKDRFPLISERWENKKCIHESIIGLDHRRKTSSLSYIEGYV